ncbi:MAG TPA: DEAD/DEAH box helicase [Candidatus Bathyarchaeia archaeon]|nr:DEAD/DEAH box helicase [Candidatus Bathyarchaeia archaeon]
MRPVERHLDLAWLEDWLPALDRPTVLELVGGRTYARGSPYARRLVGRPITLEGQIVHGKIRGTATEPYSVSVGRGVAGELGSLCSCPAFAKEPPCKHVAGLLLALAASPELRSALARSRVKYAGDGRAIGAVARAGSAGAPAAGNRARALALARAYNVELAGGSGPGGDSQGLLDATFRPWRRRGELRPLGPATIALRVESSAAGGSPPVPELHIRVHPHGERRLFGPDDLEARRLPARERRLFEPLGRSRGGTKEFVTSSQRACTFFERVTQSGLDLEDERTRRPIRVLDVPLEARLELRDASADDIAAHPFFAERQSEVEAELWKVRRAWLHYRNESNTISEEDFRELIGLPRTAEQPVLTDPAAVKLLEAVWFAGDRSWPFALSAVFVGSSNWVFLDEGAVLARVASELGPIALARLTAQPQVLVPRDEVVRLPLLLREHFQAEGIALPSRPELGLPPLPAAAIVLRVSGSPFAVDAVLEARYASSSFAISPATLASPDDPTRNFDQENAALEVLGGTHLRLNDRLTRRRAPSDEVDEARPASFRAADDAAVAFWIDDLPKLFAQTRTGGPISELVVPHGLRNLAARPPLRASLSARASRSGVIDVALAYAADGIPAAVEEIRQALAAKRRWVRMTDGSVAELSSHVARLSELSHETFKGEERVELPHHALGDLETWGELADEVALDRPVSAWRERLRALSVASEPSPLGGLAIELRQYQRAGLAWLQFLADLGVGGILADDMGLGKTAQALALLQWRAERDGPAPTLVVAPTSVAPNWIHEARRFTPGLRTLLLHGVGRHAHYDRVAEHELIVTSYALLRRDVERLRGTRFRYVILDEAQQIKNHTAATTAAAKSLDAEARLALTGTPIENRLLELWSILDFCNPGMLGSWRSFSRRYERPVVAALAEDVAGGTSFVARPLREIGEAARPVAQGNGGGDAAPNGAAAAAPLRAQAAFGEAAALRARIRPFVLRRTKAEVQSDLPPKIETDVVVEMTPAQRRAYAALAAATRADLGKRIAAEGLDRNRILVLTALLRLRQMACDPRLVDRRYGAQDSAKLAALNELVGEVVASGRRALVFSQFVELLTLVRAELDARKIEYAYLDGRTRDRSAVLRSFTEGTMPVFLLSLRAGGTGINLAAADVVIHLDPWWNPAVEDQATDRAHRIGQVRTVSVYRIVAAGTIEEAILRMKREKRALANVVIDDDARGVKRLSESDIEELLSFT